MATPPSADTRTLFKMISDGQWHPYDKIRDAIAASVAPGRALRRYEERVAYKRKYSKDPDYDTAANEDERILLGARACAQSVISSWKGRGVQYRAFADRKEIRLRPGFTSWGLQAEGIPAPASGNSEPSEDAAAPPDEPPAAVAPQPPTPQPSMGVLHESHETVTINKLTLATTCSACGDLIVSGGSYGGVTPAGKEQCRGKPLAAAELPEPAIDVPRMTMLSPTESEFTLKTLSDEGDRSVRNAIGRADGLMTKANEILSRQQHEPVRTIWDPQENRLRPATEEEVAATSGLLGERGARRRPAVENFAWEEPAVVLPEDVRCLGHIQLPPVPVVELTAEEDAATQAAFDAEIASRIPGHWDPPAASPSVVKPPVVTEGGTASVEDAPLPDAEPVPQDAEMALFRESEVRLIIKDEVGKAIDAFQVGMEQYLAEQFEQLNQQLNQIRTARGKWVYHP